MLCNVHLSYDIVKSCELFFARKSRAPTTRNKAKIFSRAAIPRS